MGAVVATDREPGHREGRLTAARSRHKLYWQAWLPAQRPRRVLLLAHDWAEHSGRYRALAEKLRAQDCAVYALDLRGHGQSEGPRALFQSFGRVENDLHLLAIQATKDSPGCKPIVMGVGVGGVIALSYALKQQEQLAGLILSAPALALRPLPHRQRFKLRLLSRIRPAAPFYAIDAEQLTSDPVEVAAYRQDPLVHHANIPARTATEVIDRLAWLSLTFRVIKLPLLIQHGDADTPALPRGSEDLYERYGGSDKRLKCYASARHSLFHETSTVRQQVCNDLRAWLAEH